MNKRIKITFDVAEKIAKAYLETGNKCEVTRQFHLTKGYGVDRALFLTGNTQYCSKNFLKEQKSRKTVCGIKTLPTISSKDTSYEEWMKANTEFMLELKSRSERYVQAEEKAAEAENKYIQAKNIIEENEEKLKSRSDVIQRLHKELQIANEQKVRWEVLARKTNATSGD